MIQINKKKIGTIGEKIAQTYLKKSGYKIISTNYYTISGEIDIIAIKNENLVFIEVKTRTSMNYGQPSEAVNNIKKKHMKHSAAIFLTHNNYCRHIIRFDVIEIFLMDGKCKINHIKQVI